MLYSVLRLLVSLVSRKFVLNASVLQSAMGPHASYRSHKLISAIKKKKKKRALEQRVEAARGLSACFASIRLFGLAICLASCFFSELLVFEVVVVGRVPS